MLEHVFPTGVVQWVNPKAFHSTDNQERQSSDTKLITNVVSGKSPVVVDTQEVEAVDVPDRIKSSPYDDPLNFLDLSELSQPVRLFALALTKFDTLRPDYATSPYMETFNFDVVFQNLRDTCLDAGFKWTCQEFYVVIFRSKLKEGVDRVRLGQLDQMSHQEACASGGLLHYWFGTTDSERRNLATCIWRNRVDAALGGRGPWHKTARGAACEMYESISFHTHKLVVEDGAFSWRLEDHHD